MSLKKEGLKVLQRRVPPPSNVRRGVGGRVRE
jgi:hypothetical protein